MSIKQEPDTVTEELAELKPDYNGKDMKIKNEEIFPQVKAESCYQEDDSALVSNKLSQGQWFESSNADIKDQLSTLNISSSHGSYFDDFDALQEKETSVVPSYSYMQSPNTDTHCETKDVLPQYQEEFKEYSSHIALKSELNMTFESSTDNEVYESKGVKDFHEYLPSSDDVFPNHQDYVKVYKCGTCPYSSNHLFDLRQHKFSHTVENFYICDLCQSSYQYFLDLKCHLTSHAVNSEMDYSSRENFSGNHETWCAHASTLKRHRRKHTGEKPYSCDLCGYTCAKSSKLTQHRRKHTGERPYSCDLCDYTCARATSLTNHRKTHTGEKPYSCDLCDYTCVRSSYLTDHRKTHTGEKPYSCDLCDYKCAQRSALKSHKRKHTGEKPYFCDLCNYTCAHASYIKKHKRIHTGEKPYSCDLCNYKGAQATALKRHKSAHHSPGKVALKNANNYKQKFHQIGKGFVKIAPKLPIYTALVLSLTN